MRDILGDLRDRAELLERQIGAENAWFEKSIASLAMQRDSGLQHLRAQLRLVNKLLEFTAWQRHVHAALAARIAVAEAAEASIRKSIGAVAGIAAPDPAARA
jgi:hypothetical protein